MEKSRGKCHGKKQKNPWGNPRIHQGMGISIYIHIEKMHSDLCDGDFPDVQSDVAPGKVVVAHYHSDCILHGDDTQGKVTALISEAF